MIVLMKDKDGVIQKRHINPKNIEKYVEENKMPPIRCTMCGKLNKKAYDWDFQKCEDCGVMLYDNR